jgi:hypothetical protein
MAALERGVGCNVTTPFLTFVSSLLVVACGARTELGGSQPPPDASESDATDEDGFPGDGTEAESPQYCATSGGPVGSCDAAPDAGWVIRCTKGSKCKFEVDFAEWGCCLQNNFCVYGDPFSVCE